MDINRSANFSDRDDEILSPWILRRVFILDMQVMRATVGAPWNVASNSVEMACCPFGKGHVHISTTRRTIHKSSNETNASSIR